MAVENISPEIEDIVALNEEIEWLGEGYGGFDENGMIRGVAEGPVWWNAGGWWNEGGFLLFSDNATNKRYKWKEGEGVTLYKEPTNDANGLTRDRQGRLIACEHASRQVTREELDGSLTVVANNYRGQRLNRPNDVVVKSDGAIYFTDPVTLGVQPELDIAGVYRVSPDLGQINLLVRDFVLPNGLAFSVDEKVLFINDSLQKHIRAFDLDSLWGSGMLNMATDRVFCDMSADSRPGVPDGMKVDVQGNVYCSGPGGIWIMDSSGKHLGTILSGGKHVTNMCFGDDDWKTLFITTFGEMGRMRVNIPGIPVPRGEV